MVAKWDEAIRIITASESFSSITQRLNGRVAYLDHKKFQRHVPADIEANRKALRLLEANE